MNTSFYPTPPPRKGAREWNGMESRSRMMSTPPPHRPDPPAPPSPFRVRHQFVFLAPVPVLLLVWMKADEVFWYYFGFLVPVIAFTGIIVPMWSKQDSIAKTLACHRVRVLQRCGRCAASLSSRAVCPGPV